MSHAINSRLETIQELVDEAAVITQRSVEVATPSIVVIAASAQLGTIDKARADSILTRTPPPEPIPWMLSHGIMESAGPVRVPANAAFGLLPRLVYPLREADELFGHLWVIDSPRLDARAVERLRPVVGRLTAALRGHNSATSELVAARRRTVRALLAGAPASGPLVVHAFLLGDASPTPALEAALARPVGGREFIAATAEDDPRCLLVVESPESPADSRAVVEHVERAAVIARADVVARGSAAGVGAAAVVGAAGAGSAVGAGAAVVARRARFCARVAALAGQPGLNWADAGAWRLLEGKPLTPATALELCPQLAALTGPDVNDIFWRTLLRYFDNARNTTKTANELFIHRATLHYRLERARELVGPEFVEDGWQAAVLHVALRLHAALRGGGETAYYTGSP